MTTLRRPRPTSGTSTPRPDTRVAVPSRRPQPRRRRASACHRLAPIGRGHRDAGARGGPLMPFGIVGARRSPAFSASAGLQRRGSCKGRMLRRASASRVLGRRSRGGCRSRRRSAPGGSAARASAGSASSRVANVYVLSVPFRSSVKRQPHVLPGAMPPIRLMTLSWPLRASSDEVTDAAARAACDEHRPVLRDLVEPVERLRAGVEPRVWGWKEDCSPGWRTSSNSNSPRQSAASLTVMAGSWSSGRPAVR